MTQSYPEHRPQAICGLPLGLTNNESTAIERGIAVGIDGKICTDPLLMAGVNMLERSATYELSVARVGSLVVVKFGGTVQAKDPLTLTTGGKFIAASEGSTPDRDLVGVAYEGGDSDEYGLILLK